VVTVDCYVRTDDGSLVAELTGDLDTAAVADVRQQLLKCLAEQPRGLFVDLSGVRVRQLTALSAFAAVERQAARWPGTPVLFCALPAEMRSYGAALYRRSLVFPTVAAARAHLATGADVRRAVVEELLPVRGASRRGRDVVTDACLRWDLPHLVAPASLISSELVANVSDHVGTMMTLQVTRAPRHLLLSVRDGSTEPPVLEPLRGHGLQIVDATAYAWGWMPATDGKVVWASLLVAQP
jgi:anti-anti-sigma regulatory factor